MIQPCCQSDALDLELGRGQTCDQLQVLSGAKVASERAQEMAKLAQAAEDSTSLKQQLGDKEKELQEASGLLQESSTAATAAE